MTTRYTQLIVDGKKIEVSEKQANVLDNIMKQAELRAFCKHPVLEFLEIENGQLIYECRDCVYQIGVKEKEFYKPLTEEEREHLYEPLDGN